MKMENWLILGAVGVGAYLLYQAKQTLTPPVNAISGAIANLWVSLTQQPNMLMLGSVNYPDGNSVPMSSTQIRTDAAGNVYTQYAGHVYQLAPSDANGNWPATLVQ